MDTIPHETRVIPGHTLRLRPYQQKVKFGQIDHATVRVDTMADQIRGDLQKKMIVSSSW
jgi:hypothetical protein